MFDDLEKAFTSVFLSPFKIHFIRNKLQVKTSKTNKQAVKTIDVVNKHAF